jgi:hypothetical protein
MLKKHDSNNINAAMMYAIALRYKALRYKALRYKALRYNENSESRDLDALKQRFYIWRIAHRAKRNSIRSRASAESRSIFLFSCRESQVSIVVL